MIDRVTIEDQRRHGFTLLELLLAASLATFVLATLMTAIGFAAKTETFAADQVDLARIGRAIIKQIERDLGAIVIVAEETEESTRAVDTDEVVETESVDEITVFLGADSQFDIVVERPIPESMLVTEMGEWTVGGGDWDGGFGPRRRLVSWGALELDGSENQFVRLAGISTPDGLSTTPVASTAVPELVEIAFRYLDQGEWIDSWDSVEAGGVPNAVEVTILLQQLDAEGVPTGDAWAIQRVFSVPAGRYTSSTSSSSEEGL